MTFQTPSKLIMPVFRSRKDYRPSTACFLRGIRILVDLVADSLHKIARGRGSSKGADNGHLPTTNALI